MIPRGFPPRRTACRSHGKGWQLCRGLSGRGHLDSVAAVPWNTHTYQFLTSVQRHYKRLSTFPEGFVVLGDAISNFNPIYGQGMSSAALQVQALQQILTEREAASQGLAGLLLTFSRRLRKSSRRPGTSPPAGILPSRRRKVNDRRIWRKVPSISLTWMPSARKTLSSSC